LRDIKPEPLTPELAAKLVDNIREDKEKNEENTRRVKPDPDPKKTQPFIDPAISNFKNPEGGNAVTNPIQNFDGPDMDALAVIAGGRFAPPDTNAAVGPNHVVITTNGCVQVFNKTGVALTSPALISTLLVGVPNFKTIPVVMYGVIYDYPSTAGAVFAVILVLPTIILLAVFRRFAGADALAAGFRQK